ncbi:MAG: IS200/IS605 family element transposase accessory protein TnpB [Nostocaceae cyanobacterium]|nr:IS200/IS605 family element transposase accessory protein TnpB [Nostocaceae cyanobacterium]
MRISFKTELKLNNYQRTQLAKHAGVARHAWNWGLDFCKKILNHNRENPLDRLKFPSAIDLHKILVKWVKSENPWYYEVSKTSPQYALKYLSSAFSDFFRKKTVNGRVVGFPKFKKKGINDSFTLEGIIKIEHRAIQLPKLGKLRTYERLPQGLIPKTAIVSRSANRWFMSFSYDIEPTPTNKVLTAVGVDLGIKTLATLSTGETFPNPQPYRFSQTRLARLQSSASRKVSGSKNRHKANMKVAKLHATSANIRKDTLNKLTTHLAKNHSQIVIEDLNVSGMMANHCLAKSIADLGMYEFRRQLTYKAELYGAEIITVNRFFPSSKTCSSCGHIQEMPLNERVFDCQKCEAHIERDLDAALNLRNQAAPILA